MGVGTVENFQPVLNPLHGKADLPLATEHIGPDAKGLCLTAGHPQFTDPGDELKNEAANLMLDGGQLLQMLFH